MGRQQPKLDQPESEDGKPPLDMTEKIRKARRDRLREEREENGWNGKAVAVPLKPGERV